MLRAFGFFVSMFCLLCLVVQLKQLVLPFAVVALALFAIDLLQAHPPGSHSGSRRGSVL